MTNLGLNGPSDEDLTFSGAEGERFIQAIRKQAFIEGKHGDNKWIAAFVSCCLTGDALRWHAELPADVKCDWNKLELALLKRYPSDGLRGSQSPVDPFTTPNVKATVRSDARLGIIAVRSPGLHRDAFISYNLDNKGRLRLTHDRSMALDVRYVPGAEPLEIHSSSKRWLHHTVLGLTRGVNVVSEDLWLDDWFHFTRAARNDASKPGLSSSLKYGAGPTRAAVWSVASGSGVMQASWNGVDLLPLVYIPISPKDPEDEGGVRLVVNEAARQQRYAAPSCNYYSAELVFQPIDCWYSK